MTEYLSKAIQASIKGGLEIMNVYTDPTSDFQIAKKADNSPVTIADKRAHAIISSILATTPFPILSEEGQWKDYRARRCWETLWIVDPLDGTKEFIKKNDEFTVNIALVRNNRPVIGVIYAPALKVLYFGAEGSGAYKIDLEANDMDISDIDRWVQHGQKLPFVNKKNSFVVVASRSHLSDETLEFIDRLKQHRTDISLVSKGSSLKICLVAEGKADIYPRFAPTMEWDTAAGHAIVRAAGGEIYQLDEKTPLQYNKENLLNPWFIAKASL